MRIATDDARSFAVGSSIRDITRWRVVNSRASISDLQRLERLLHEKRELVEAQLENLLGRSEDQCGLALNEDVFGAEEEAMLAELNVGFKADVCRLRKALAEIEAALRRHANATYGICTDCGRTIAVDRLLSQPTAERCEPCDAAYQPGAESKVA